MSVSIGTITWECDIRPIWSRGRAVLYSLYEGFEHGFRPYGHNLLRRDLGAATIYAPITAETHCMLLHRRTRCAGRIGAKHLFECGRAAVYSAL